MVVGSPRDGPGRVRSYSRLDRTGSWTELNTLSPGGEADDFGASVAVSVGSSRIAMVVGAPRSLNTATNPVPFGAAFYYELTGSSWAQRGIRAVPVPSQLTAGSEMGAAVAVAADSRRMAVGAPSFSLDFENIDNVSFLLRARVQW